MNLLRNHTRPASMDDFSDLQTPVYKRQRIDAPNSLMEGGKDQVIYMPSDSLAYSAAFQGDYPIIVNQPLSNSINRG